MNEPDHHGGACHEYRRGFIHRHDWRPPGPAFSLQSYNSKHDDRHRRECYDSGGGAVAESSGRAVSSIGGVRFTNKMQKEEEIFTICSVFSCRRFLSTALPSKTLDFPASICL